MTWPLLCMSLTQVRLELGAQILRRGVRLLQLILAGLVVLLHPTTHLLLLLSTAGLAVLLHPKTCLILLLPLAGLVVLPHPMTYAGVTRERRPTQPRG